MTEPRRIKFGVPDQAGAPRRHEHGDRYEIDERYERMVIAPSGNHASLLFELAGCWESKSFWLLYVLVVDRGNHEAGRYQSPHLLDSEELREFLTTFAAFLEQDGRHAFWIASGAGEGTLVYDRHDVIYAYGSLPAYREVLERRGFVEQVFSYPDPHMHCYHAELDAAEDELLARWDWQRSPLLDGDDD